MIILENMRENKLNKCELNSLQGFIKRSFDLLMSSIALFFLSPLLFFFWVLSSLQLRENGFFIQQRVGRNAKLFNVYKLKTMKPLNGYNTTVTSSDDPRITTLGSFLRKYKIDELPQLFNVVIGDMSLVGPRPDVSGFADKLIKEQKAILSLRPGITGPASLKYKDEELLLANEKDPEAYNRYVIWPDKVDINLKYIANWSFLNDLKLIIRTVVG